MDTLDSDLFKAKQILKSQFGFSNFRTLQEQAIASVLAGSDTFVLMPTGGGKSLCYQIPALVKKGTTIVISPLIALMKDQVDGLKANGIAAEFLNSTLSNEEQTKITQQLIDGDIKLLYISAERLATREFYTVLKKVEINLFAIDEAHCISAWGHDFRPDYTKLSKLKALYPDVPIIALTATADQNTRSDILKQLELDHPQQLIDSFDRPNITLTVLPGQKRLERIRDFLRNKHNESGIIYCLTRKQTESLAQKLLSMGIPAASYHAGMNSVDRTKVQRSFVRDKTQVICATIAFGMGIDKSNVRWVIHYNMPKNIEGYYQELGRAGRDSAPAHALLFYTYADVEMIKRFFLDKKQGGLQLAKLERMKEYAEGVICRRKILLRYFDEEYDHECGNCDICSEPYETRNGTKITQKVLEHIGCFQDQTSITTNSLVASLAQMSNKVSYASWHFYLAQLKNHGILKVNIAENQSLQVTKKGRSFSVKDDELRLVLLDEFISRQEKSKKKHASKTRQKNTRNYYKNPLFEQLKHKRAQLAKKNNLPAYIIFSDATLLEMANERPMTRDDMLQISGVGEVKWERYGKAFLSVIEAN